MNDLSANENEILKQLRDLRPYETLTIIADAQGRPDSFLLTRSSKVLLVVQHEPQFVRGKLQPVV